MAWLLRFSLFSFVLITLSATPVYEKVVRPVVVVWNVGQGQWVTAVEESLCRHFDVGGKNFPWKKIAHLCRDKKNLIYLSHWDWDHIGALAKWPPAWSSCIALRPLGNSSDGKMKLLSRFAECAGKSDFPIWKGYRESDDGPARKKKDSNALSQVVLYKNFLLPGDSPIKAELQWEHFSWVHQTRVLVLGHHGSRTSTSDELLNELPHLKMAIASARWERYKHPHAEVIYRLQKHRIPLLKTEDWGNLWFE